MKPPNETGALLHAPVLKLQSLRAYHLLVRAQVRRALIRRCVSCDSRLTNQNLGGNDGRSALTDPTWCYRCADKPCQLVLRLGP
jgi:hypothetical protein